MLISKYSVTEAESVNVAITVFKFVIVDSSTSCVQAYTFVTVPSELSIVPITVYECAICAIVVV